MCLCEPWVLGTYLGLCEFLRLSLFACPSVSILDSIPRFLVASIVPWRPCGTIARYFLALRALGSVVKFFAVLLEPDHDAFWEPCSRAWAVKWPLSVVLAIVILFT